MQIDAVLDDWGLLCVVLPRWGRIHRYCRVSGRLPPGGARTQRPACQRLRKSVLQKTCTFVASLLVCTCDWMVKCGINSRTRCKLRQLQQVASALCTHAVSLVDCFGRAEMFWLSSPVYIEVAPFFFLTPLLRSLVCEVIIRNGNAVNEQSWLISLMFQWKLEFSQRA